MKIETKTPREWIDYRSPINKQILFCLNRGNERLIKDCSLVRHFDFSKISVNDIFEIIEKALITPLVGIPLALGENDSLRNRILEVPKLFNLIKNKTGALVDTLTEDPRIYNLINNQLVKPNNPTPQTIQRTTPTSNPGVILRGGIGSSPIFIHSPSQTPPPPKSTQVFDLPFGGRIDNIPIGIHTKHHEQNHSSDGRTFILEPTEQIKPKEISLFDLQIEKAVSVTRQRVIRTDCAKGRTPFFLRAESLSNYELQEEFKFLSPLSHYTDLAKEAEYKNLKSVFEFGKSEHALNSHNIRSLISWAKEHPSHNFSLGLACNPKLIELLKANELLELKEWAKTEENKDKNFSKCLVISLQNITEKRKTTRSLITSNSPSTNNQDTASSDQEMISLYDLLALKTRTSTQIEIPKQNPIPEDDLRSNMLKDETPYIFNLYNYLKSDSIPRPSLNKGAIGFMYIKSREATRAIIAVAKLDKNKEDPFLIRVGKIINFTGLEQNEIDELSDWAKSHIDHNFSKGLIQKGTVKILKLKK